MVAAALSGTFLWTLRLGFVGFHCVVFPAPDHSQSVSMDLADELMETNTIILFFF